MSLKDFSTIEHRRQYLEKELGISLESIGAYPKTLEVDAKKNCENMIGVVQIPLGIAGPLVLNGDHGSKEVYVPLATTEGALVASVNRGCKVIRLSGGAIVQTVNAGMTRGSVFAVKGIRHGREMTVWLEQHKERLQILASQTSSHLELTSILSKLIGTNLFVRFVYDTQDAMGMNMVTIATQRLVTHIIDETDLRIVSLAGNFDVDKKPSWLNIIEGRGRQIWAEVTISKEILQDTLKTTAEAIHEVCTRKCLLGSIASGSMGFNAHFANVVAAIFIASGQDPAHVSEGSTGFTTTEVQSGNLYLAIHLPDLPLGTVGGGTSLSAQQEALSIMGVSNGNAEAFAEIIGGSVLAGELSLLASLSTGGLAQAHETFARHKKILE